MPDDPHDAAPFEVPESWNEIVLELMLEGPITVEEHDARAGAAPTPSLLN
jgi:hypothetical protein